MGVPFSALEFMDGHTISALRRFTEHPLPEAGAMILVEGGSPESADRYSGVLAEILKSGGALEIRKTTNEYETQQLWAIRESAYKAITQIKPIRIQNDPAVPVSRLPDLIERIDGIAGKYGLLIVLFGHAGEGNLHPTFMVDRMDEEELERVYKAMDELYRATLELGGTSTGEHGIGLSKKKIPLLGIWRRRSEAHAHDQEGA